MMKNCIVSLISEQTVPNFLFIKDRIEMQDSLLFISSDKFKNRVEWIKKALGYANCHTDEVLLNDGEEEQWDKIVTAIKKKLSPDIHYKVNLTCGTKYMMLAVHQAFQGYAADFYYIPYPKNTVLEIAKNLSAPLSYRISIEEYLTNYGVKFTEKKLTQSKDYTESFFNLFVQGRLSDSYKVIDSLRNYRDKHIDIQTIETIQSDNEKRPQIPGLSSFLSKIKFPLEEQGKLSKKETEYLTGGWFEEYVYHRIENRIHPQDIKLGLTISRPDELDKRKHVNDLDVVFTYGNKLFVVECKTGILGQAMFNQTVYKAASIKEILLGLSGNSYIFSLAGEDEKLEPITKTMGINYFHRSFFVNNDKFEKIVEDINKKAKN